MPRVWVFSRDFVTVRLLQRRADDEIEVRLFGPEGLRRHETFRTEAEADAFRLALEAQIRSEGVELVSER